MESNYNLVTEDSKAEILKEERESSKYLLKIKGREELILFPRGSLEKLAKSPVEEGREIIDGFLPPAFFNEHNGLSYNSINLLATKAYSTEQNKENERMRNTI